MPLLGHVPWFLRNRLQFLEDCARRYGATVPLNLRGPVYLVLAPEDVRHVQCSARYRKSDRNVGPQAQRIWGKSLITLEGETHRQRRIDLVRALHAQPDALPLWKRSVREWWSGLRHGAEFELQEEAENLARTVWLHCLFGEPRSDLLPIVQRRQAWIEQKLLGFGARPDPSGPLRRVLRKARGGIAGTLIELGLPEAEREEELLGLSVEGYEGTAQLLVWAAVEAARHPDWNAADVVGSALRNYPPTWLFARVATATDRLPSGIEVSPGTRIFLSPYLTQRLFPECELLAFGVGPRRCPGRQMAERQAQCWIDELRRVGHLRLLDEPVLQGGIMLKPAGPVWVRFDQATPPRSSPVPEISVVVPSRNRPRALVALLRALLRQTVRDFEVVICDDGSEPPLAPFLQRFADRLPLRVIRLDHRHGPAFARQMAIDAAVGQYLVFTDDDCCPAPDWLGYLYRSLRAEPHIGVGGSTSNGLRQNWFSEASQSLISSLYKECPGEFLATNNLALERTRLAAVGGLPSNWPISGGEDRELCRRWTEKFPLRLIPEAHVLHYHRLTLPGFVRQHFNYGRGGAHFEAVGGRLPGKSVRFWWEIFRRPFREYGVLSGLPLAGLLCLAQLANGVGHVYEKMAERFGCRV